MTLYLIRHGRTDWNDLNYIQGKHDIPLNSTGIEQAHSLAGHIRSQKINISHIYTSHLKRAYQTANILSGELNIPFDILPGLEEVDLGEWEGRTWHEVKEIFPSTYNEWYLNRRYTKSTGGESYNDMLIRVVAALTKLTASCKDNVAVVTHSAVIMALMCFLNDVPFEQMLDYKVRNASVTAIDDTFFKNNATKFQKSCLL